MDAQQRPRLRVGIIGLGRLWESRHQPSLARLADRFQVTAVYDQVQRLAELEAERVGCRVAKGLRSLINQPDVDAIYLLATQWFGLHPVELAIEAGKAIYCALPTAGDPDELARLADRVEGAGVPFMPEFARRYYPASRRLRELLATTLGKPRLVIGLSRLSSFDRYADPGPAMQVAPVPLSIDPGGYLLDWCVDLFGASPESITATRSMVLPPGGDPARDSDFESFTARFPGGGSAQVSSLRYHRDEWGEADRFLPAAGFQVFAERGAAWVEMPNRVQWSDASGVHDERLPLEPSVGDLLNEQFRQLVQGENSGAPTIRDALEIARLVRDLRRSQAEGVVVNRGGRNNAASHDQS